MPDEMKKAEEQIAKELEVEKRKDGEYGAGWYYRNSSYLADNISCVVAERAKLFSLTSALEKARENMKEMAEAIVAKHTHVGQTTVSCKYCNCAMREGKIFHLKTCIVLKAEQYLKGEKE